MSPLILSLASGSKANCTLVSDGQTHILIDFGLSCRKINERLARYGLSLDSISAVFLTHEHSDHVAGLPTLFKRYSLPVYITEPSHISYVRGKGFDFKDRFTVTDTEYSVTVGGLKISAIPVRHDSAACVALRVEGKGVDLGICTDVGCPSEELFGFFKDCGCVITECNYDDKMLMCGIYPENLKYRIRSECGHTCNEDCADFVCRLALAGVKRILLAHVSPENNTPELAVYVVSEALKERAISLDFLAAAPRDEVISLL